MRNNSTIPVLDLRQCSQGDEFIIKKITESDIPDVMRKPHRNNGYKIGLLLEGSVTIYTDFKQFTTHAPALLFLSPDQVHQHTGEQEFRMVHIAFTASFLQTESQGILSCWECLFNQVISPVNDPVKLRELLTYTNLMIQESGQDRHLKQAVLRNLLNSFIIAIARLNTCETNIIQMDTNQNKLVRQFKGLVDEHFLKRTQVSQYADMLYVTPGHLNDLIKSVTGRTAKQLIDEKRIIECKRLLFWGILSVKEIANQLNFEDDAYFSRFFKKHTGLAPAQFQRNKPGKVQLYPA